MEAAPVLLENPSTVAADEAAALAEAEHAVRAAYSSLRPFYSNLLGELGQ